MHQTRTFRERAQDLSKSLELGAVVRRLGIVRGREVREDPVDLDVGQRRDRPISRRGLFHRSAEPREASVDLEVHPRRPAEHGRRLADSARPLNIPDDEEQVLSDRVRDLRGVGRTEEHEDRSVDAAFA